MLSILSMTNAPWPLASHSTADSSTTSELGLFSLLKYYDGAMLPPSSRVDPMFKQAFAKPLRLVDIWKYGYVAASKLAEVATNVLLHFTWGPRKPSWGIEMTIITSLLRNSNRHSQLISFTTLRRILQIGGLVPLPSDAMVTPVVFVARRQGLRGILADFDAAEDGTREITGEWVVGKRLWRRLNAELRAFRSASNIDRHSEKSPQFLSSHRVVLYLHGGAYYFFSAATHRLITIPLSKAVEARVFAINYRLAPETRFPGPLHDVVCAYFRLVNELCIPPENIIVAGDSAGGGLSLALLMYLRDNGYALPGAALLFSPWVDLTMSCDSWVSNAPYDVVPPPLADDHLNPVALYLGDEGMRKYLTHPYASPLFGRFEGLPPLLMQSGEAEVLRDEITLLAHKATMAGVEVRHELYDDAVHVFQMFPFLATAQKALASCREFIRKDLDMHPEHLSRALNMEIESTLEKEVANKQSRIVDGAGAETHGTINKDMGAIDTAQTWLDAGNYPQHAVARHSLVDRHRRELEGDSESPGDSDHEAWSWKRPNERADGPPTGQSIVRQMMQHPNDSSGDSDTPPDTETSTSTPMSTPALSINTDAAQQRSSPQNRHRFTISGSRPPSLPMVRQDKSERRHRRTTSSHWTMTMGSLPSPQSPSHHSRLPNNVSATSPGAVPTPTIRAGHRAKSHPDIAQLCSQWASQGPANTTTTYRPIGASDVY